MEEIKHACPAPECHEQLQDLKTKIYGNGTKGGIIKCLQDKVPKKWIWAILAMAFIPGAAFTGSIWYKTKASDLMYAQKPELVQLSSRVNLLEYKDQELRETIKERLNRIEATQCEMRNDIKKLLEERRLNESTGPNR